MSRGKRHSRGATAMWLKINRGVDRFGAWATAFGVLTGALSWLGKKLTILGDLGWPEAIFVGLFSASFITALFGAGLAAWRYLRPAETTSQVGNEGLLDEQPQSDDFARLEAQVGALENIKNAIVDDYQRMSGLEAKFNDELGDIGDALQEHVERVVRARDAQDAFQERMEAWVGRLREQMERRFEWVDQGFSAILDRERLVSLAAAIEEDGEALSGPTRLEPVGDWAAWRAAEEEWHVKLDTWVKIASVYRDGVSERVMATPERLIRGVWKAPDDLFPDSSTNFGYKTFRIRLTNFREERPFVDDTVRMAAFARPSLKGRGSVPRDEKQMPYIARKVDDQPDPAES
jgi:hypothetical protein